jgi:hypothetical protein
MISKLRLVVSLVLLLVVLVASGDSVAAASPVCNSTFVKQAANMITIAPTGTDDTVNIQCAFDLAVAARKNTKVQLLAGMFRIKQIVVYGFVGQFSGAGADKTIITNLPNLYVAPVNFYFNPPSDVNPYPALFSFVDADIAISDLAIRVIGNEPTQGWTIFGIDPPLKELAIGIGILGTKANAQAQNILIEGELMPGSLYGYNLINGIYFEGFIGASQPPISGSFAVYDSTFRKVASGAPIYNLSGASVMISRTRNEDVYSGLDAADLVNTHLIFSNNTADAFICGYLYNMLNTETAGTNFLMANNVCRGTNGFVLQTTFGAGNKCLLTENDVQQVTDVGYYLYPGINGCTIIGDGTPATVINLGTGNKLINVTGVGKNSAMASFRLLRPHK